MFFRLNSLLEDCAAQYKIRLCAGKGGIENHVTWVYPAEDSGNAGFIKSNELIITTGFFSVGGMTLYEFISKMIECGAAGMILNVGKYFSQADITPEITDLCDKNKFPLYIMPWEVYLTDVMQTLCDKLLRSRRNYDELSAAFSKAIVASEKTEDYIGSLESNGFSLGNLYCVAVIDGEINHDRVYEFLGNENNMIHILTYGSRTVVIFSDSDEPHISLCRRKAAVRLGEYHTGISMISYGADKLSKLYRQALDALKTSYVLEEMSMLYEESGIFAMVFALKDDKLLQNVYIDRLKPIEEYDALHGTVLADTLYYYLKTGGSLSETAKLMYTHRNTIGYRMNKIRTITEKDFEDSQERYDYMTALYIRRALMYRED
ncbi:MAG: PucR family transcriptional regulator ligand-binding domain-containing protein [Clostridia bacterium]|nr:PucR family transcriptional regulator ligand-binding domain-containing protein [Clostridia bacterium]